MFFLQFILMICVNRIGSNMSVDSQSVLSLEDTKQITYICLDQITCRLSYSKNKMQYCSKVSSPPGVGYFTHNETLCKGDKTESAIVVPDYIKNSYPEDYVRAQGKPVRKLCNFDRNVSCYVVFDFKGQQNKPENNTISDFYIYGGVAVILMIVVLQTACIIMYKRKVAKTRKTLHNVLCRREQEMNEEKDRYSAGPDLRKNSKLTTKDDDNIYESLENIVKYNAKDNKGFNKTWSHSHSRPRLPLPFEMQAQTFQINPTPPASISTSSNRLMESRQNSVDRRINSSLNKQISVNSLTRKHKPLPPSPDRQPTQHRPEFHPKPYVTRNPITLELNQVLMRHNQLQAASNSNIPMQILNQSTLNQFPLNESSLNRSPVNQSPLKNAAFNQPSMNRSTRNLLTPNERRNQSPSFLVRVQEQGYHHQSQTTKENDSDSSDEEWTYEKLSPMQKYLR